MKLGTRKATGQESAPAGRQRRPARLGSPPTARSLGFVILVAAVAPLSSALTQPGRADAEGPSLQQGQPVLCLRDLAASGRSGPETLAADAAPSSATCPPDGRGR